MLAAGHRRWNEGGASGDTMSEQDVEKTPTTDSRAWRKEIGGAGTLRQIDLLKLLSSLLVPVADVSSDWGVTLTFWEEGETFWFHFSLAIQGFSGLASGLLLAWMLSLGDGESRKRFGNQMPSMQGGEQSTCKALCVALPIGLAGLAPAAMAYLTLVRRDRAGLAYVTVFKVLELFLEALPQSVLQTYIGVSYGQLDPDSDTYNRLFVFSIFTSVVGSALTFNSFELLDGRQHVNMLSLFRIANILLRAAQTAALIFWAAMITCAFKGTFFILTVLSVVVYMGAAMEGMTRGQRSSADTCCKDAESFMAKVSAMSCVAADRCALGGNDSMTDANQIVGGFVWGLMLSASLFLMKMIFENVGHTDNNYLNRTLPDGDVFTEQHYNCKDRSSGLNPANIALVLSVLLLPVAFALDQEYGLRGTHRADCCGRWGQGDTNKGTDNPMYSDKAPAPAPEVELVLPETNDVEGSAATSSSDDDD